MPFKDLPPEIIGLIAASLANDHPPTLLDFARVNKSCHACSHPAIKSVFFHTITIRIGYPDYVATDVDRLCEKLKRADTFRHVRRLVISGEMEDHHAMRFPEYHLYWNPPEPDRLASQAPGGDMYDGIYANFNEHPGIHFSKTRDFRKAYKTNDIWAPVADLVKQLPSLVDLVYRCRDQVPPCLLDALHEYRPRCRLHMDSFFLRSLNAPATDSHEFRLVTSPSLYSIMLQYNEAGGWRDEGVPCHQKDALHRVLGLAPNLKELLFRTTTLAHQVIANLADHRAWKCFTQEESAQSLPLAQLRRLRLADNSITQGDTLRDWGRYTDFDVLQDLTIQSRIMGEALEDWALNLSFPSVKTLSLNLTADVNTRRQNTDYYTNAKHFLRSLPPLTELELQGWHPLIPMCSFVDCHGPRLRKVTLSGRYWHSLTLDDINQIAEHCPLLEELKATIPRSQGDRNEVALYKALGGIRKLKYLDLILDVSDVALYGEDHEVAAYEAALAQGAPAIRLEAPADRDFDEFDRKICDIDMLSFRQARNGHIKKMIINCAIDRDLASAIFNTISSSKPQDSPLLQRITIRPRGTVKEDASKHDKFQRLTWRFACSWQIERRIEYDRRDELIIKELEADEDARTQHLDLCIEAVFRRIWPDKRPGQKRKESKKLAAKRMKEREASVPCWWGDWHSFPLATDP